MYYMFVNKGKINTSRRCIIRNLQKNLNIIRQPPFLDKSLHFALPPLFKQQFWESPISINFEKVNPAIYEKEWGALGLKLWISYKLWIMIIVCNVQHLVAFYVFYFFSSFRTLPNNVICRVIFKHVEEGWLLDRL